MMSIILPLAEAQSGGAGSSTIVAVLGAGGLGAIAAAMVTGFFSRRKLGAEATEIITNAAAGVVTSMEGQLARSRSERQEDQAKHERQMAGMAAAHVRERQEWIKVLQLHVAWDVLAIQKLADSNLDPMPAPPPLRPAQRFVDDNGFPLGEVD